MRKLLIGAYYVFTGIEILGALVLAVDLDLDIYSLITVVFVVIGAYLIATSKDNNITKE